MNIYLGGRWGYQILTVHLWLILFFYYQMDILNFYLIHNVLFKRELI